MFATQAEYRLVLPWRFGVVAFGGSGEVAPGVDKFRGDEFLPSGGTGTRFSLSKKYHVNLRTDFAWGRNAFTWTVGVAEAFRRLGLLRRLSSRATCSSHKLSSASSTLDGDTRTSLDSVKPD